MDLNISLIIPICERTAVRPVNRPGDTIRFYNRFLTSRRFLKEEIGKAAEGLLKPPTGWTWPPATGGVHKTSFLKV